jgi:hypothetical protein
VSNVYVNILLYTVFCQYQLLPSELLICFTCTWKLLSVRDVFRFFCPNKCITVQQFSVTPLPSDVLYWHTVQDVLEGSSLWGGDAVSLCEPFPTFLSFSGSGSLSLLERENECITILWNVRNVRITMAPCPRRLESWATLLWGPQILTSCPPLIILPLNSEPVLTYSVCPLNWFWEPWTKAEVWREILNYDMLMFLVSELKYTVDGNLFVSVYLILCVSFFLCVLGHFRSSHLCYVPYNNWFLILNCGWFCRWH